VGAGPAVAYPEVGEAVRPLFALNDALVHMDATTAEARLREVGAGDEPICQAEFPDVRWAVAPGFGCDGDEIVVTHSTTDSICKILGGLDLGAGDEVLTTNHEHYGSMAPLAILRDRRGVVIRQVEVPVGNGHCAEAYVDLFASAVTARTKVLLFSAPTATTGTMLPVRMLARLAQENGLISVVDGAHIPGMLDVSFHELGVDFLAGSGYKWQYGPPGTGLLYIRNKVLPRHNPRPLAEFWPIVSIWYPLEGGLPPRTTNEKPTYDISEYIQNGGSASVARMQAFRQACETWDRIGRDVIERHVLGLSAHVKERIAAHWGDTALFSPYDDTRLCSALTAFNPFRRTDDVHDEMLFKTFVALLRRNYNLVAKYTRFFVPGDRTPQHAIRISTRVFHSHADVGHAMDAMTELAAKMA
jgi:isopenicillin-N epimerase